LSVFAQSLHRHGLAIAAGTISRVPSSNGGRVVSERPILIFNKGAAALRNPDQLGRGSIMSRQIIALVVAAIVGISTNVFVLTDAMAQYGPDSGRVGPNTRYNPSGVYYHHRHGNYYHGGYR
jgi:hypothetical protein